MEYFMIILIWWTSQSLQVIKYPMDNYEHCMEVKDGVREALQSDLGFIDDQRSLDFTNVKVAVSCPKVG